MVTMNVDTRGLKPSPMLTITHVESDGVHECKEQKAVNAQRVKENETTVTVFRDVDNIFNLRVGYEFVEVNCCPFCGVKLC